MRTHQQHFTGEQASAIPLLDASSLPAEYDWAVLESIEAYRDFGGDIESDVDRFGRFHVRTAYDE